MVGERELKIESRLTSVETKLEHLEVKLAEYMQANKDCVTRQTEAADKLIYAAGQLAKNQPPPATDRTAKIIDFLMTPRGFRSLVFFAVIMVCAAFVTIAIVAPDSLPEFTETTKSVIKK